MKIDFNKGKIALVSGIFIGMIFFYFVIIFYLNYSSDKNYFLYGIGWFLLSFVVSTILIYKFLVKFFPNEEIKKKKK